MPPVTKTEAVKNFLIANTWPDLAALYHKGMELQVSVLQDGGERVEGEFKGRQWSAWTDNLTTWKDFRIPLNANTDPTDNDGPLNFDLSTKCQAIGMTGWDWQARRSRFLGYDFDSIVGHVGANSLTDEELAEIRRKAESIPWVTVRRSTSGNGIHLYVFLDVETENHTAHAALARCVLGRMSALAGYDFHSKVDAAGAVLWVYHRKMVGTGGLTLLKQGEPLTDIPLDWRDHIPVVTGKRQRTMPQLIAAEDTRSDRDKLFDELTGQNENTPLDDEHNKLIDYLKENRAPWNWVSDHHMLVTHTFWLREAHKALGLKGPFETLSTGKDRGNDLNCFLFPIRNGGWAVRRYGNNTSEASTWSPDRQGYMRCFLNREPSLEAAAASQGATKHKSGGFSFLKASEAVEAAKSMGATVSLPDYFADRAAKLVPHKGGGLLLEIEKTSSDRARELVGWNEDKTTWHQILDVKAPEATEEVDNYDNLVRHLVTERKKDAGWVANSDRQWIEETKGTCMDILVHHGVKKAQLSAVMGSLAVRPWVLVKVPFAPEYPGGRTWNRNSPRLKYAPSTDLDRLWYPTWLKILQHIGKGLDDAVKESSWCQVSGVLTGADYLKCWVASLLQEPLKPLPYLFLYSREENTGKSILAEALELIIIDGVVKAKQSLTSQQGFNGELESKILCVVEEGDLKGVKGAKDRVKEWVNSPTILIHPKGVQPYQAVNCSHWIQTSNEEDGCPVDSRDTRITMVKVSPLDPQEIIAKEDMFRSLIKEAPDFLAAVLSLEIPPSGDRLNIPILDTEEKRIAARKNQTALERYLEEQTYHVDGATTLVTKFYEEFRKYLDPSEVNEWNNKRIRDTMPDTFPRGRRKKDNQMAFGNLSFVEAPHGKKLVLRKEVLTPVEEK